MPSLSTPRNDMLDQRQLETGVTLNLFEASLDEGTIRQKNTPTDQIQRMVITDRNPTSPYKIQVLLRTCIHGTMDIQTKQPASLIIVDYSIMITKEGARFSTVDTSFEFSEYLTPAEQAEAAGSFSRGTCPSVIAYAPFEEPVRFNYMASEESKKTQLEVKLSPEVAGVKPGEVSFGQERESTYSRRYFDQGLGGRNFDQNGCAYRVWWNLIQNKKDNAGVPPKFRVAILLQRTGTGKFQAKFGFAARGGFGYRLEELTNRWLRRTAVDDPIIFDPSADPIGSDLDGMKIDQQELRKLKVGSELANLGRVWGLNQLQKP
ncbi:uncharacterized protein G6M90_00g016590 [Metarhizium brunneum]|uniref:Uncharacterized protein n=1 Tax=Metarhizium brunneum TaxID=500148 RepID=A0A7D5YTN7_9HYPO